MYPKIINGNEPNIIKLISFWLFRRSNKSFLKQNAIANKEPKCKLISINNELDLKAYIFETNIK